MKRLAVAVCAVVLVLAVAAWAQTAAQPKSGSVEQELIKLENGWIEAVVKSDSAFLDRILADDITETDPEGNVLTKVQDLAEVKSGAYVITSGVMDDIKVRVYGDTAVVTGRNTIKGQYKGKDISGQTRWTDTWVNHAGRWQCVATHSSRIAQK
ncbi:MAG TPA: nuclear transport factor 2 family protein [Acidobacteriota bacterium]|nr:nuclear transport factor 2 family protein [Acidobacteriota bacterium]